MLVSVKSVIGVAGIPKHRTSATHWLIKAGVPIVTLEGGARRPEAVALADLPQSVGLELSARHIEAEGLEPGERDEAAHARLEEATPKMQAKAARLAQLAVFMVKREVDGWTKPQIFAVVRKAFGAEGTSEASLWRILRTVRDLAPANFAPALLDDYNMNGRPCGPNWDEAWHFALAQIAAAHEEAPLDAADDRLEAVKAEMGWHLPSRGTFHKRWQALPSSVRLTLRHGAVKAQKLLRQPAMRNRGTLAPMDIWSPDGRTLDLTAKFEDNTDARPVDLRLVDVGSGKALVSRICKSENAVDTVALILEAVRKYGIPKCIDTDNSRSFSGRLVAGGAAFKFRKRKGQSPLHEPPGLCHHLGIEVRFTKPANGQTKLLERSFRETGKRNDAAPEFKGAHNGSSPGRKPDAKIRPVPIVTVRAVHARELAHHNDRKRQAGFAKGRSFNQVFDEGRIGQIHRIASERQLYLASLIYKPVSVDRNGRFKVSGWTYGQPDTQDKLLAFHDFERSQAKGKILVGVDPQDFSRPAVAYDCDGRKIAEVIKCVIEGDYQTKESARDAARYDKVARVSTAKAKEYGELAGKAMIAKANAAYEKSTPTESVGPVSNVVEPRFNAPLKDRPAVRKTGLNGRQSTNLDTFLDMPSLKSSWSAPEGGATPSGAIQRG